MHTVWVRLNAVVFFGLSALLGFSVLAAVSKIGHANRHVPDVKKLQLNKLKSLKAHGGVDRALLSFDLNVDLNPAFHWNIKQLFVYVVAEYSTDRNPRNQIVLWDRIVEASESREAKVIKQDNIFVKYALIDQGRDLRGEEVKLQLMWDHMPLTGTLYMGEQDKDSTSRFNLPISYR